MGKHICHAIGCSAPCPPEKLMCANCWNRLPASRRRSVLREYRSGQCDFNPLPSPQWHDAAAAAIYWLRMADLAKEVRNLRAQKDGDQNE